VKTITFIILTFYCLTIYPIDFKKVFPDSVYKKNIKTVLIYYGDDVLRDPVINLNSSNSITLTFDDLSNNVETYYYDFILCNEDWMPSDISQQEYLDGFSSNMIENYSFSFNTFYNYIHYKVSFPNEKINFKASGNYLIVVYKDMNPDSIVLTKKFYILDQKVDVKVNVRRPIDASKSDIGQEISFKIITNNYYINNPLTDIKIVIMQNGRNDNIISNIKPLFIRKNELIYDYQDITTFDGGAEFRYFNIKSMRYLGEYIKAIEYKKPYYYVELYDDNPNTDKSYFFNYDINGKYKIDYQESNNDETDADYVFVKFSLLNEYPFIDGDIYILGALTDWKLNNESKMNYNYDKKAYEKTLLLKQGYYNYQYVFLRKGQKKADISLIEGSHYQTKNDYSLFIYHHQPGKRYDELIGYTKITSENILIN
jgi:hypothetical protein